MYNLALRSSQITQCHHVFFLVDNQHRQRTDNVKAGNNQDKSQEDIGYEFLHFHNTESVILLFITVLYVELIACYFLHLALYPFKIAAGLQSQFQ